MATIDTEGIKARIDLRDLVGQRVELRKESTVELSGPCPKCGGTDRLHVTQEWFFCRQCHPKRGDVIEWVQWVGLAADFRAACEYLGGPEVASAPAIAKRRPAIKRDPDAWKTPAWQQEAREILARAQALLAAPAGERGRAYLMGRGLTLATREAWELGYKLDVMDPALGTRRPAIVIPWRGHKVTAIKYRFLTVPAGGKRYTFQAGSKQIAMGFQMTGDHWGTLWLVEGEINAISLWQALREAGCVNFDVLSFGGEQGAVRLHEQLLSWAEKYRQVIIWADDPEKAQAAMGAIPGAFGLRSLRIEGQKMDANALLTAQPGALAAFALEAWRRFDADPVCTERLRAELGVAGTCGQVLAGEDR